MDSQEDKNIFQAMKANGDIEIIPSDGIGDIENKTNFKKIELTQAQRIQLGGLWQQLPALVATNALSNAYILKFPEGIAGVLTPLKQGGYGTMLKGDDGRFVGTASLYSANTQVVILNAFNTMSIVSGQYFLSQINSELKTINLSLDKILEFLHGEKNSELLSEISFTKYAYQNFTSIMEHEQQRIATISSLQAAKKVAIKDMEFYMTELNNMMKPKISQDISSLVEEIFELKERLELSMQLYMMSNLLEVYYSQNYDSNYIHYTEEESTIYIGKCEKHLLSILSMLSTYIHNVKENPLRKIDKLSLENRVNEAMEYLSRGTEPEMCRTLRAALHASEKKVEYYIKSDGTTYLKAG